LDDAAALGNRDWSATGRNQTVREAVASGYHLYEVVKPDPALQIAPDRVRAPNTAWTHTAGAAPLRHPPGTSALVRARVPVYRPAPCPEADTGDDCEGRKVFVLRASNAP